MEANKSLLDLLNNNTPKQKNDREQLLALFRPQQTTAATAKSPEISSSSLSSPPAASLSGLPSGGNSRNSNANDLLATLMGTSSPRQMATPKSRAEDSANLLSTLMGSSKPSTPSTIPERERYNSPPMQTSYVNPRHEYLAVRPDALQDQRAFDNSAAVPKPLFAAVNPFDELEEVTRASQSASPSVRQGFAEAEKAMPQPQVDNEGKTRSITSQQRHASTPNLPFSTVSTGEVQPTSGTNRNDRAASIAVAQQQEYIDRAPKGESPELSNKVDDAPALRLATGESSVCNIPSTAPYTKMLSQSMPVTKMVIKADVLNRNIIAASRKYFAYPVVKDGSTGAIRLVDQDDGQTTLLEHHHSKVVNLSFAKSADADGVNALISTDVDSNVVIWSLAPNLTVDRVFEVAGPSDGTHKSRAKWNNDGNYFAVSITSRIYVFDYRSILAANKAQRIKLHPDAKHCLCVCKADKAVKDYSFALDGTAMVAVDKNGNLRLWILDSSGKTLDFIASISTGDKQLLSVEYVSSRHVIVGTQSNECLILVDILAAKNAQELRLPGLNTAKDPMFSKMSYNPALGTLTVANERRQSIYLLKLDLPTNTDTAATIIQGLSPKSSHVVAAGQFGVLLEFGIAKEYQKFLSYTTLVNESNLDIFVGHEKGYNLFTIPQKSLDHTIQCAQVLETSAVAKMQSIGQLIMPAETTDTKPSRTSSPDVQSSRQTPSRAAKKNTNNNNRNGDGNGAITVEPRINEISARLETTLRASFAAELQKAQLQTKTQIEAMQASNDARHETILRLVSETLSKNTTKVLKTTVAELFEQSILPNIQNGIKTAVSKDLQPAVSSAVEKTLTQELKQATHEAVEKAFKACGIVSELESATSTMKDNLNARHKHMEQNLAGALVRLDAQILERQKSDSEKIDRLMRTVEILEQRIAAMSTVSAPPAQREIAPHHAIAPIQNQLPLQQNSPYQNARALAPPTQAPMQPQVPVEDFAKYHDLVMDFVTKTQKISAGDYDGVPFVRQFLSWQPETRVKDGITKSLGSDQLQLLAFVHALASELKEDDAFNRVHWITSAVSCLDTARDPRLDVLGPRLIGIIRGNLAKAAEQAAPNSQYAHLLDTVLSQLAGR